MGVERDGFFGSAQLGDATIDALFDEFFLYVRINAPWSMHQVIAPLALGKDGYIGGAPAFSPVCREQ